VFPHLSKLEERVRRMPQEPALQDASQRDTLKLYRSVVLYQRMVYGFRLPLMGPDAMAAYAAFEESLQQAGESLARNPEGNADDPGLRKVGVYFRQFSTLSDPQSPRWVPGKDASAQWMHLGDALMTSFHTGRVDPFVQRWARLSDAWIAADRQGFAKLSAEFADAYAEVLPSTVVNKVRAERSMNQWALFQQSIVLYLWVLVGVLLAWLMLDERLQRGVFWFLLLAVVLHSAGLILRMVLHGRPPVTNLYSSAVFVGWGAVVLGLFIERHFRNGIGAAAAALSGFLSLIIASHLMTSGDTMEMMRAVLDSNFWLATHVVTISLGYSATFLAGFLGLIYCVMGIFSRRLDAEVSSSLLRMTYGVTCFALLFSFVGTVLGGIWADQSWGRFWGWDPKENGALLIVIWTALMLHAKRGGVVDTRGFMLLAIFGNVVTSWSWFGTNMLGVGLHSYGFMSAGFLWLMLFWGSQFAVMALAGWLPQSRWRSSGL
jgi:ABC-type transport system involved in cytochrome c biogenesis permease subunit